MSTKKKHISGETPTQRLARYRENKKKREASARAARRLEVAENRTKDRRLSFLVSIIVALGYTLTQVGRLCGISQQSISWIFGVADDCSLSKVEQLLRAVGAKLSVIIKRDGSAPPRSPMRKSGVNSGVKFKIAGRIADEVTLVNPKMPAYINSCSPENKLYFLAQYIPSCGMRITKFSAACGIKMTSLKRIFKQDDIKISQLFKIAKATGGVIVWKVD